MKDNDILTESNLAIIGSRTFNNFNFAKKEIIKIIKDNHLSITKIISGGASGSDRIAELFADKFNIPIEIIRADWSKGINGGVIRNTEIIKNSDCVIAFWDGKSKGTEDSIRKAKRMNKKLFIVKINPEDINEGVRSNDVNDYDFDFNKDYKTDILTLKYNKDFITKKITRGVISYYSFRINKDIDKKSRFTFLNYVKNNLIRTDQYDKLLNKAIIGLFNNPNLDINDVDVILFPQSSSSMNFDIANKIKNKIPNSILIKDSILKNDIENVTLDYESLKKHNYKQDTILSIEDMINDANVDGIFKVKKIPPKFRRFILNFLKLDVKDRNFLNKLINGKVLVVDDIILEGTTFNEIYRLIKNYTPREIILYSLIG